MAKKISILLEDDWELLGKGLGNTAHLQYLPSLYLMNIARELQIKLTFMVDVMQQLAFIENMSKDRNIRLQKILWDENVMLMKDMGFDVQLHIHPQWYRAKYKDGYFYVNGNWNISNYDSNDQARIIEDSIYYLTSIVKQVDKNFSINSFKAGSWALQPSKNILENLKNKGIKIVMGVAEGIKFTGSNFNVDYTKLEETKYPFYPDFNDITIVSDKFEDLFVIPIHSYELRFRDRTNRAANKLKKIIMHDKSNEDKRFYYHSNIPSCIRNLSPMKEVVSKHKKIFGKFLSHIDLSTTIFSEFKYLLNSSISYAEEAEGEVYPILIESHSKVYEGNYRGVREKLEYMVNKFGSRITFQTTTEFLDEVRNNRVAIKRSLNN